MESLFEEGRSRVWLVVLERGHRAVIRSAVHYTFTSARVDLSRVFSVVQLSGKI